MRKVAIGAAVFVAAAISLSGGSKVHAQETKKTKTNKHVIVQRGDSLSKIAKKHDTTYQRLYYANKVIKHPDLIYPEQKLRVPSKAEKLQKRAMPADAQVPSATQQAKKHVAQSYPSRRSTAPTAPVSAASGGVWDRLAACESGGNWSINTGNGYYGGLQFSLSSWRGVGGQGYPHQASKAEQIRRGEMLRARGGWGHWPACSAKLGLR